MHFVVVYRLERFGLGQVVVDFDGVMREEEGDDIAGENRQSS